MACFGVRAVLQAQVDLVWTITMQGNKHLDPWLLGAPLPGFRQKGGLCSVD